MTTEAFIAILNTGKPVIAESKVHQKMHELSQEALKITTQINQGYHRKYSNGSYKIFKNPTKCRK